MKSSFHYSLKDLYIDGFRALNRFGMDNLSAINALIGGNNSGKSTVFAALLFLRNAFEKGLLRAWYEQGGTRAIKAMGQDRPVTIAIGYGDASHYWRYHITCDERDGSPFVKEERLEKDGKVLFSFSEGKGVAFDRANRRHDIVFRNTAVLAAGALGAFEFFGDAGDLCEYISMWQQPDITLFVDEDSEDLIGQFSEHLIGTQPSLVLLESPERIPAANAEALVSSLRRASRNFQVFFTTYSPLILNQLNPDEVWLMQRSRQGESRCLRLSDSPLIRSLVEGGGRLGDLWMEGFLEHDLAVLEKTTGGKQTLRVS